MSSPVGTAWRAIVARCQELTEQADAYYVGKRELRRAASVVKDLKFNKPDGFFKRK